MDEYESLSHTTWDGKYHVVFIPKCRRRTLYQELRRHLGEVFRRLALQKESKVEEGHLMPDHVHMLLSIPPKHAVSQVVGYIKGKSAIHMARVHTIKPPALPGDTYQRAVFGLNRRGDSRIGARSLPALRPTALDPLQTFKIVPADGRKARESGLWLKVNVAPVPARVFRPESFGRRRRNFERETVGEF
jgi:putative transposase